jgi:hypothetical protein
MTDTNRRSRYEISTYVAPDPQPAPLSLRTDSSLLPVAVDLVRGHGGTAHARQDDDDLVRAKAHLVVSLGYVLAAAMTIAGLLILAFLAGLFGEAISRYVAVWIGGVGIVALLVMAINRRQQHHYSAAGIGHHDIESRERIARHAIDTHADLLIRQWEIQNRGRDR